ncbi:MAG: toxin-antitoxin system HicB family antitoxin [Candidatus Melainabacteria bacterium]|nr:toxin-antitoxin system HicB family antitoxin [Candidatus Melainabacteria bacterium]
MAVKTKAKAGAKKPARKAVSPKKKAVAPKAAAKKSPKAKAPKARAVRTVARAKTGSEDFTSFSGKFTVRLPKSLHQALVDRAEKEGVSLNLFVTNALSRTVATPGKKK